jgi:hypothetical protein
MTGIARVMLLIATLWCVGWFVHSRHYWEDDAYIHLEFARSVAQGHGYEFNGHVVNGDTSSLWVILLVVSHALIPDWMIAGKVLTVAGLLFALSGAYFFAKRLTDGLEASSTFAAGMVLLLVTNPYFCYWAFSGMEALTAAGVAFWSVYAATARRPGWPSFLAGCFLAGLGPVLRPEMVFFTALVSLLLLRQWFQLPGKASSPPKLIGFLLGAVLVLGPFAIWSIYALHTFGRVIPNTNAAKRANPGESVVKRLLNVYGLGFPLVLIELVALALFAALRPAAVRKLFRWPQFEETIPLAALLFVAWTIINTVFYIADHTYVQTRYIFVSAPGLLFALLAVNYRRFPRWTYQAAFGVALIAGVAISVLTVWPFIRNKTIGDQAIAQVATFIRTQLPPDAPVAVYAIGELSYVSQHPIIDIGGITRPGAIPYLTRPGIMMVQWARSEGAKYYMSGEQPEPGAVLIYAVPMPEIGWSLNYRHYARKGELRVWKLPDSGSVTAPESNAAAR